MSDTDVEEADTGKKGKKGKKEKKDKGGKSNLVPAIVLSLGLCIGGYFLGPAAATAKAEAMAPTTTAKPVLGEIATIEAININLADGHFLRVGVALQLIEGVLLEEFEKGETVKANDLMIAEFGGAKMEELATAKGRDEMKERLKEKLKETYEGEVVDVFFTDFVMQ